MENNDKNQQNQDQSGNSNNTGQGGNPGIPEEERNEANQDGSLENEALGNNREGNEGELGGGRGNDQSQTGTQ